MSAYNNTGEQMIQIDHKRAHHEQNYRRAEAFLLWKLGGAGYDEARRFLRGSGMDWPSLFVEFVEKVEEELLARLSDYDKVHSDWLDTKAKCNLDSLTIPIDGGILEKVEAKFKAYNEAVDRGDAKEVMRLAPNGPTYEKVVKPRTRDEEQRMIDFVNKTREEKYGTESKSTV